MCWQGDGGMTDYAGVRFYFQYANPVESENEIAAQKRPRLVGGEPWESSPYYYWWLFLKENKDYLATCDNQDQVLCRAVYADFGDIRELNFMDWWGTRGRQLFCEPHGAATRVIDLQQPDFGDPEFRLVLEIERFGDLDRAIAKIREIAQEQEAQGDFGRGGRTVSRALYQLFSKPNPEKLRQRYRVWQMLTAENPESFEHIAKHTKLNTSNQSAKRAVEACEAEIKLMIKYAGQGVFPVTSRAQAGRVDAYLESRQRAVRDRRSEIMAGLHCEPFGPHLLPALETPEPNQGFRNFIHRTGR